MSNTHARVRARIANVAQRDASAAMLEQGDHRNHWIRPRREISFPTILVLGSAIAAIAVLALQGAIQ